jgi:hypothetical protein
MPTELTCDTCTLLSAPCEQLEGVNKPCWTCSVTGEGSCSLVLDAKIKAQLGVAMADVPVRPVFPVANVGVQLEPAMPAAIEPAAPPKLDILRPVEPKTERERRQHLMLINAQRRRLQYQKVELVIKDTHVFVDAVVEKYWKHLIFFYPVFGSWTPVLLLGIALLLGITAVLGGTLPLADQRKKLNAEIERLSLRATTLANVKLPAKESSFLEFMGLFFLILTAAVMLPWLLSSAILFCFGRH